MDGENGSNFLQSCNVFQVNNERPPDSSFYLTYFRLHSQLLTLSWCSEHLAIMNIQAPHLV